MIVFQSSPPITYFQISLFGFHYFQIRCSLPNHTTHLIDIWHARSRSFFTPYRNIRLVCAPDFLPWNLFKMNPCVLFFAFVAMSLEVSATPVPLATTVTSTAASVASSTTSAVSTTTSVSTSSVTVDVSDTGNGDDNGDGNGNGVDNGNTITGSNDTVDVLTESDYTIGDVSLIFICICVKTYLHRYASGSLDSIC